MIVRVQDIEEGFEKISKQLDAVMEELMGGTLTRLVASDAWEPQWNFYERSDRFLLCVDLAGMSRDEFSVYADRGILFVTGARGRPEFGDCDEDPSVHVMEIDWGRFERRLPIPASVDVSRISATYRNGYLWIIMPKVATPRGGAR